MTKGTLPEGRDATETVRSFPSVGGAALACAKLSVACYASHRDALAKRRGCEPTFPAGSHRRRINVSTVTGRRSQTKLVRQSDPLRGAHASQNRPLDEFSQRPSNRSPVGVTSFCEPAPLGRRNFIGCVRHRSQIFGSPEWVKRWVNETTIHQLFDI
jgi:hypothetical protein